jgi:hypothetical protein
MIALLMKKNFKTPISIQITVSFRIVISYVMGSKNIPTTAYGYSESTVQ